MMTMPLALLAWTGFLGLLHAWSTGLATTMAHGMEYASSPRDEQKPVDGVAGRNMRAFANFMQTFPIFAAGVLISSITNLDHGLCTWGAQLYFWARLLYVPLYLTGAKFRTPVWLVSFLGILLIYLHLA